MPPEMLRKTAAIAPTHAPRFKSSSAAAGSNLAALFGTLKSFIRAIEARFRF